MTGRFIDRNVSWRQESFTHSIPGCAARTPRVIANANSLDRFGLRCPRDPVRRESPDQPAAPDVAWMLWPARKRHPADHRSGMDVHGHEPGSGVARRLRVSEPDELLL